MCFLKIIICSPQFGAINQLIANCGNPATFFLVILNFCVDLDAKSLMLENYLKSS